MTLLIFIIVVAAVTIFASYRTHKSATARKALHKEIKLRDTLSGPAYEICKKFRELPDSVRPDYDIVSIVKALDIKHGGRIRISYSLHTPEDHQDLMHDIENLEKAVALQEQALQVSRVSGHLDNVDALREQLRTEAQIATQVTKELS